MSMSVSAASTASTAALRATSFAGPPPPREGGGPEKTTKAVADLLGIDADTLKSKLAEGSTMSDLAAAAGVEQSDLVATIAATLPTSGPDGVATDTTSMATAIASGSRPGAPAKPEADAAGGLSALSQALGVSDSDLLDRLTNGTGISDLLDAHPEVRSALSANQNRGALVDGYS